MFAKYDTNLSGDLDLAQLKLLLADLTDPGAKPPSDKVRRCRLIVSKPVLRAPMISALEATV